MAMFGILNTSGSGLYVHRKWMDAISDNIANVNTIRPFDEPAFQERFIEAQERTGGGIEIRGVRFGDPEGRLRHDPTHPLANEEGYVRSPDMDLSDQMVGLLMAQRGYQAGLAVIERARSAYQAALQIGR